jgi:branched-subunit amino acid transport protein
VTAIVALGLASIATYAIRVGSVGAFQLRQLPPTAGLILRHAALGIMASLVITTLPSSSALGGIGAASAAGLLASTGAARRTGNLTLIMLVGVAAFSITRAVLGVFYG